ncbi:MAG: hypothetical protein KQ78_00072 [Candidatus Izimaplasma bacterium HR2]|nr:MAG: hypothetical protein KQ78_00072 [Candidatus Izimaplasma bacterium HR2]
MEQLFKVVYASLSFMIPLVGIGFYLVYSPKKDAKLFGIIGVIGIFVYISVGLGFI